MIAFMGRALEVSYNRVRTGFTSQVRFILLLVLAVGYLPLVLGQVPQSTTPQESPAVVDVEKLIQKSSADVAVAFRSLEGKQELFIGAYQQFHAASTIIKIPVMIELYAESQAGELRLTDTLLVHNSFRSIVGGSIYHLDPKDDSDSDLYKSIGKTMTLRDLCEHMIKQGSNLAADLLIEKFGIDRIQQRIHALHADGVEFLRGFEKGESNDEGLDNTTSARGLMALLYALAKGEAVSPEASEEMIGVIARSTSPGAIAAGLQPGTRTAPKIAEISGIDYEATIVYGSHSFVLVILVRDIKDPDTSTALMAQIAHALAASNW